MLEFFSYLWVKTCLTVVCNCRLHSSLFFFFPLVGRGRKDTYKHQSNKNKRGLHLIIFKRKINIFKYLKLFIISKILSGISSFRIRTVNRKKVLNIPRYFLLWHAKFLIWKEFEKKKEKKKKFVAISEVYILKILKIFIRIFGKCNSYIKAVINKPQD